ncbi:MAG: SRPBCC domain-containing protein [Acidobacteria bacterium]|nr:SRPBCC domain-containing protein [Acidobacteriota bacterium]
MNSTAATAERTLIIDRLFDAPPEIVFEAWTKPEHLTKWWGPNNFTLPFCELDFRVGGRCRFCMRSPAGEDHWVWGEYREIERPKRLSFTWNRVDANGSIWNSTIVKLTFADAGGKTKFTLNQTLFDTTADRDDHNGGWTQCLERLNSYVSAKTDQPS